MPHEVAYSFIGWNEAFSSPPAGGLDYYLRALPRQWLVTTLAQISTTLFNSDMYYLNPRQQIEFVLSLKKDIHYNERIARFIDRRHNCVIVHPEIVSTLFKYALLYGAVQGPIPGYAYDHLMRALLLLNTKYGEVHGNKPQDPPDPCSFLSYELETMMGSHENFSFVVARYYQFIQWAKRQDSRDENYLPIADDFPRFFGMTYEEYATAAFAIFTAWAQRFELGDWRLQIGELNVDAWTATLSEQQHIKSLLSMLSQTPETAIARLSQAAPSFGLSDLRPFVNHPLLRLGEARFVCPYQGFLRNRLGAGLYFALFDKYKEQGSNRQFKLSRFFARFLEDYLHGLVAEGSKQNGNVRVFPEQCYRSPRGESKSSDIIVVQGSTAVFMEITRKRFKMNQTLCERNPKSLEEDIDQAFVKKARQIHHSIEDFKNGLYHLVDVDPNRIQRYVPAIITEQDFPLIVSLPHMIHAAVRKAGWLTDYEPLQILAAEDIEAVYTSAQGTSDLANILLRKASHPGYRSRDLASYLVDNEQHVIRASPGDHSLPGYREFFDTVVTPKLREWGLLFR